jgi:hypothetical protein
MINHLFYSPRNKNAIKSVIYESIESKKHLSNREKRQIRKKRLTDKFTEKDSKIFEQQRILQAQAEQIAVLSSRLTEVDGKINKIDLEALKQAYQETQRYLAHAENEYGAAFQAGDGAKATLAMKKMYDAQKRKDEIELIYKGSQAKQVSVQQPPVQDHIVAQKAQAWAAQNRGLIMARTMKTPLLPMQLLIN